ncbi:cyclopropane-fatty-acyl-phospholipid synthase [Altererythrobacter atlanticus]|uniref:Cyclopropane-fatty-acyl-phospholipid synthase n=1 Tax=Croceibacterium atlanticum TaxID=1267766 RepID=A0A0F7KNQ8_9SPHN|nr:cyclopropane-fatty-acyl-phospholipid synthase family protein [Croceibacterium atlanticum]AKH41199.1 Cyclopropane-fatty-acyl-phospholipid synthase [Croceibacterium atlanticum]MBB5732717.1 cyclopropane-fatty-acyl-phospholipid synthase [Croceibacterium atlanticum]
MSTRLIDRLLSSLIHKGTLELTYADGTKKTFGEPAPGFPDVAIRFTDSKVPRDIVLDIRLGVAEAYMDGRIQLDRGDIMQLVILARANSRWDAGRDLGSPKLHKRVISRAKSLIRSFNKPGSSKRNVAHHYDIGNALYELMLDPEHMQYSCAYWAEGVETLAQAQEAKLAHIAAKLDLKPGQRVLDIGCGWGGMAIFLAQRAGVDVLGITLSEEQLALARKRAEAAGVADKVRFELIDYRELPDRGDQFDRIVSVGMFEHVGTPQYETFFRTCARLMKEDGVALIHTIGRMGKPGFTDAFTDKYIFPGGYIPALSETVEASEKVRLIASDVETLRVHYAKTIDEWYANCMANKDAIVAMYDDRFFRMWTFYLAGAATSFTFGGMCNYQIQYIRQRDALPLTRNYMEKAENALLQAPEQEPRPAR